MADMKGCTYLFLPGNLAATGDAKTASDIWSGPSSKKAY